jgi:hypothetical protein
MSQLSILIISCDRYADIWHPFFTLFWKYWPDCPYPVILGTNEKQFSHPNINMLNVGVDKGWALGSLRMMESVKSDYVLILLEDFFFYRTVDSQQVDMLFRALVNLDGAYLRLKPFPPPDIKTSYSGLGLIERGAPYRVALQAAIWKREVFIHLLQPGENPWQMELRGTVRSEQIVEPFYCVWQPVLYYRAGVTMGEWTPSALRQLRHEGIFPDLTARPVMSYSTSLRLEYARGINRLINTVPWKFRRKVGDSLRKKGWLLPREG